MTSVVASGARFSVGGVLEFKVLGPLEVRRDGAALSLGGPGQRALCAILILCAGEAVSTDRLFDLLWAEEPPDTARHILHINVSRLRKVMENDPSNPTVLLTRPSGYMLQTPVEAIDAMKFQALVGKGRSLANADPARASATFAEALALWRGTVLSDLALDPFILPGVATLEELRITATEERMEAELALGHHVEVVSDLQRLAMEWPLRERITRQLMLALYRSGRQSEALGAFEITRARLATDLGIDPGSALMALERAVLQHDPSLDPVGPEVRSSPASLSVRPVRSPVVPGRPADVAVPPRSRRRRQLAALGTMLVVATSVVFVLASRRADEPANAGQQPITDTVVRIDQSGAIVASVQDLGLQTHHAAVRPQIAIGEAGVWIIDATGVTHVDPSTSAVEARVPIKGYLGTPTGHSVPDIAVGARLVWITGAAATKSGTGSRSALDRIDPATNQQLPEIWFGPGSPTGVVVYEHSVWEARSSGVVDKVDAMTGRKLGTVPVTGSADLIAAGEGAVWIGDLGASTVTRIDANSDVASDPITLSGGVDSLAVGEGGVWVLDRHAGTVTRIDPTSGVVGDPFRVGSDPGDFAVGLGSLWVSSESEGTVWKVDPISEEATLISLGAPVASLAIDETDGSVWLLIAPAS